MPSGEQPEELDLTNETPLPPGAEPPLPTTSAYDLTRDREGVRGLVALIILLVFAVLVVGAFACAMLSPEARWKQVADSLGLLLSPVVALAGAVTGFYYGEKAGKSG